MNCTNVKARHYNLTALPKGAKFNIGSSIVKFDGEANSGQILIETLYKQSSSCAGQLMFHRCILRTGIVSYRVKIAGGLVDAIALPNVDLHHYRNNTIRLTYPPLETASSELWPSTIGGIASAAQNLYGSNITSISNGDSLGIVATGMVANTYINSDLNSYTTCNVSWTDPMPDILIIIRELTFRAAFKAFKSNGAQKVFASSSIPRPYYVSSYRYLVAAMLLTFFCTCVIVPLFAGWWYLGRAVSLSPIETAKAFRAPLLHGTECNGSIRDLLQEVGYRKA